MVLPDSTIALDYMLDQCRWLIEGLVVVPDRMLQNLEASHGLVFSGRVLLQLVESGLSREAAYEIVQRNALRGLGRGLPLRDLLEADPDAAARPRTPPRSTPLRPGRVPAPRRRDLRPHAHDDSR